MRMSSWTVRDFPVQQYKRCVSLPKWPKSLVPSKSFVVKMPFRKLNHTFFHHSTHTIFGWRINVLAIHPLFLSFSLSIQHVHKCNIFRRYRFFGLGRSANAAVYVCRNILRRKPSLTKFQVAFGLDAKYQRDAINLSNTLRADYAGRGRHFICNVCGHFFTIFTLFPSIQFQIIQSLFRSFCADKHGRCMYGRFM